MPSMFDDTWPLGLADISASVGAVGRKNAFDGFDKVELTLHSPAARPPNEANFMVSETTQTKRRRHNRDQRVGVKRKRRSQRESTPSFPLDPASGINTSARTKPAP